VIVPIFSNISDGEKRFVTLTAGRVPDEPSRRDDGDDGETSHQHHRNAARPTGEIFIKLVHPFFPKLIERFLIPKFGHKQS